MKTVLSSSNFFTKLLVVIVSYFLTINFTFAQSVNYPLRPIKIYVGFAPGGAPDIIARLVGQKLSERLGQPVIVENRPGATGNIAAQVVSKADPDGYSLLLATVSLAISPAILGKVAVNPEKELDPVGMVASVPLILISSPKLQVNSVADLTKIAKANPEKINYASVGNGSPQQLAAELFQIMAGVKMTHIPYKGGAPATQAVLANEVDIFFAGMPPALPFVKSGQLQGLAVTSAKRSQAAPEIPTMQESGLVNFDADNWNALYAPRGTPKEVVILLNKELNKVLQMPEIKNSLEKQGAESWLSTPTETKEYLVKEIAKWTKVVKVAGVKPE
jgi:tripartite-type tricarboxylate transporter receptor subunit TctC